MQLRRPDRFGPSAARAATLLSFSDTPITHAANKTLSIKLGGLWADKPVVLLFLRRLGCPICRVAAQDLEALRPRIEEAGGRAVALTYESFGTGSDTDKSFTSKYFAGDVWTVPLTIYDALFIKKGLLSGFGLWDIDRRALAEMKERGITGNYAGLSQ